MSHGVLLLPFLALMNTSTYFEGPTKEDGTLASFYNRYLEEDFVRHPCAATRAGDHRFDDRMDDLSPAARLTDVAFIRKTLDDLPRAVDYPKLSRAGKI